MCDDKHPISYAQWKEPTNTGGVCPLPRPKRTRTQSWVRIWTELKWTHWCLINLRGHCESVGLIFSRFCFSATILPHFPMTFRCNLSHNCAAAALWLCGWAPNCIDNWPRQTASELTRCQTLVSALVSVCILVPHLIGSRTHTHTRIRIRIFMMTHHALGMRVCAYITK